MAVIDEEKAIDQLAVIARTIDGMKNAYGFGLNPDQLPETVLPALLFYPLSLRPERSTLVGGFTNTLVIRGSFFHTPRMAKGGKLRYIENDVIRMMPKFRQAFQDRANVNSLLSLGAQKGYMTSMLYGSGGLSLTHAGIEFVGLIIDWEFKWTC